MARLRIEIGDQSRQFTIRQNSVVVGRAEDSDVQVLTPAASRKHFRIRRLSDGGWALEDLKSTNGTQLNGKKVRSARLKHKDEIRIGSECTVHFLDPTADATMTESEAPSPEAAPAAEAPPKPKKTLELKSTRGRRGRRGGAAPKPTKARDRKAQTPEPDATPPPEPKPEPKLYPIENQNALDHAIGAPEGLGRLQSQGYTVTFGPFEVLKRLSAGGMGVVCKARHRKQKYVVALKVLRQEKIDPTNIARFKQEAWAISAFHHPNIVKVRDLGDIGGMNYIAMDFIDGEDLLAMGIRRELTYWEIVEIVEKLTDVLRVLHSRNIWHRDVKPQNVLLDRTGELKLIDFGIATLEREEEDARLTAEGLILGTPAFISPEQARHGKGAIVDGRSDLYSLGAVMYFLLTGHRPFGGKTAIEVLKNNLTTEPPHPHHHDPHIPQPLVEMGLKLLRKSPEDRFQSAELFLSHLRGWKKSKSGKKIFDNHKKYRRKRPLDVAQRKL